MAFSYALPVKSGSSPRVPLWRRLRRLGAVAPTGSVQVLPDRPECVEIFQWLATVGLEAVLAGWMAAGFSDTALEAHGTALFRAAILALALLVLFRWRAKAAVVVVVLGAGVIGVFLHAVGL